jgi:hypothetical protein
VYIIRPSRAFNHEMRQRPLPRPRQSFSRNFLTCAFVPHRHSQSRLYRDDRSPRYSSVANIWAWHDAYSAYRTPASDTLRIPLVRPSTSAQQPGNCRGVIHIHTRQHDETTQHLKPSTALIHLNAFAPPRYTARNNIQETLERSTVRPFKGQALQDEHRQWRHPCEAVLSTAGIDTTD